MPKEKESNVGKDNIRKKKRHMEVIRRNIENDNNLVRDVLRIINKKMGKHRKINNHIIIIDPGLNYF